MKSRLLLSLFCLSILSMASATWAQTTGQITGSVRDNTGAVVGGAKVTVADPGKGVSRTTTTNSEGEYLVSGLGAATYDLGVTAPGFKTFTAKGVVLQVGQKARVDVDLQVGALNTEVVVQGTQVAQVETQSSDLSGVVSGKQITQLQLNGRNFTQLITLVPGVSNQTGQDEGQVGIAGNISFSVNGGRVEYNNWELDGGDNMDNGSNDTLNVYPSIDAIGEFRVLTSNYGAQYGRNGSGTVEVETKSGTNSFHGDAYEFVRNDAFNAKNYFDSSVPPYKKNDWGYTIGGPLTIPGVYNKDRQKTFFFWSQEWRRDRVPNNFNQQVPSIEERAGNFADQCPNPDPEVGLANCPSVGANLTTQPEFLQNAAVAQALLPLIPLPNQGSGANSFFVTNVTQPTNWREELLRVDHNLTNNARLTFRYIHDSWQTIQPTPLWTNGDTFPTIGTDFKGPGVSVVARLTNTFSPTLLNEFVFSYTTDHIILNATGLWKRPAGLPIGDLFGGNGQGFIPGISLTTDAYGGGFAEDPGYIPNGLYNSNPTYTYRDNVSKIVGTHNLQFGAYFVAGQKNELGGELGAGSIPGFLTFDSSSDVTSGNAFADLLLGRIASFGQQDVRLKYYNRFKYLEPYFQDDWHVTSRLTLNLGLRVSLFGTYRDKQHFAFNFDPARYVQGQTSINDDGTVSGLGSANPNGPLSVTNLPNGIVQCGVTPGVPVSCMNGHLFNPAPRIGFAWDPAGNGKTAIRGGYGIFFEHANGNEGNTESLENSPPLANTLQQNNISGYANVGTGSLQGQLPLSVNSIPTKATWPYVQQWHLDVQRDLVKSTVLTLSYVGSKGTHLNRQTNINQLHSVPLSLNPFLPGEPLLALDTADPTAPFNTVCGDPAVPSSFLVNGQPVSPAIIPNLAVACGADPSPFRPFQGYGDITFLGFKSSSIYHAFQTSLRHQMGGLQFSLAYTYSHAIDDSSDRYDASFTDAYQPELERANSNFDQRHILNISYVYDLPFFKSPGVANKVLGGWQFSGITSFQTGTPYSVLFSTVSDNAGLGNGVGSAARADIVGDPFSGIPKAPVESFGPAFGNPDAFVAPRGLTVGNSGRNVLTNPHRTNFDMALFKHFAITEHAGFEFRAEAFNIFNHTQWGNIAGEGGSAGGDGNNTFSTDPTSGFLHVSSAHNPRILQLGLKFLF
jgi:Carboxypeptidase regulatory-like domain